STPASAHEAATASAMALLASTSLDASEAATTTTAAAKTMTTITPTNLTPPPGLSQAQTPLQAMAMLHGVNGIGAVHSTRTVPTPIVTSALDRGALGLAPDEEQWVREKMEYALYDFQILSMAIKRYKWQLSQCPKDISRLTSLKEKHMEDPLDFLRQLKSKEFRYPEGQKTIPAPVIEWSKYQFPPANRLQEMERAHHQQHQQHQHQHHHHHHASTASHVSTHPTHQPTSDHQPLDSATTLAPPQTLPRPLLPATRPLLPATEFHQQSSEQSSSHIVSLPLQNQTIDHSSSDAPLVVIQPGELGTNSNITYNHMNGNVEIHPGTISTSSSSATLPHIKPLGTSREGSSVRDDPKPPLYNIPWSDEEQELLERLLEVYPDEPVAAQRFQKISAAMKTRTPKQVASRVQKYFIKLVKAGLEAPGRMNYSLETSKSRGKAGSTGVAANAKGKKRKDGPTSAGDGSGAGGPKSKAAARKKNEAGGMDAGAARPAAAGGTKKKQKAKSLLGSGSGRTSGTQYLNYSSAPTVYMSEEDDEESVQDMLAASGGQGSSSSRIATHLGFSCNSCGVEPILGIRYSCMDCEELGGTELCGLCYNSGAFQSEQHLLSHRFQAVETADMPAYSHDHYGASSSSSAAGPSGTNSSSMHAI
ncbi:ZZ-type zinc finger-containing protein 3, partial [Dissophora globulifera]